MKNENITSKATKVVNRYQRKKSRFTGFSFNIWVISAIIIALIWAVYEILF